MAIALAGEWFASALIPNLVDKVTNYLTSNLNLLETAKDSLESLSNTLLTIKATIDVVESQIMTENQSLNEWLRKLKLLVYEAEDLIDVFQARSIEATIKAENKVSNFMPSSLDTIKNTLLPDEDLKQLEKITKKFEEVSRNIGNLVNLVNMINTNNVEKQERTETISLLPDEMELVGRDNELGCILDIILESKDKPESSKMGGASSSNSGGLVVIPIVGLGGVGKTALAQVVYNNQEVSEYFNLKAWVCSSNSFDIKILMEKTSQLLGANLNSNLMSLEYASKKLTSIIKNMKFLFVFDDVSKKIENQWDVLYTTLCCGAPRNVIIITTQNKKFADRVATLSPIVLDTLEWDKFLELFYHHTFDNIMIMEEKREILEPIAVSIAEKLHGLPLAAKIIGNLLRCRIDENEWTKISKSEWWNIREGVDAILPSVGLNYQYLKPWLRQCFAYCSIFPKNYLFQKERLIQMWIAHNFIPNNNYGVTKLEDKGREWFAELVENSFFQPAWDHSKYVMHNLMHDLATTISRDECFTISENTIEVPKNIRHLALETNNLEAIKRIDEFQFKQLRTILYFGHCKVDGMYDAINETLSKSKHIRLLDLSHMHMQNKKPPIGIQHLSHLRFLDISSTGIELLSSDSFEHYHLQTLILQECKFKQFPRNFNNHINSRHLYASPETISQIQGIGKLTNLQNLNEYRIGTTDGHKVTELREMNEISENLLIVCCENIGSKGEAEQANLMNKKYLSSIEIRWTSYRRTSNIDKEILEGLEPHKGITSLVITNYVNKSLPNWVMVMHNFSNLKSFILQFCMNIDSLPSLGQLPSLSVIMVQHQHSVSRIGDQFYGNTPIVFPVLNELQLFDMSTIEEWSDVQAREIGRNLSKLEITDCKNLRDAPLLSFGTSLKNLFVKSCNNFNSLSRHLQGLNSLTVLRLQDFTMKITIGFHNLALLEHLWLISCPEMQSEGSIQSLANLKRIEIDNCPLLFGKSVFSSQEQKNKRLRLQENRPTSLKHLDLDHNLLYRNDDLILANLTSVQFLHYKLFELNQFTIEQDSWFRGLITLKELRFSSCNFEHLPARLITLPALKKLTLTSCHNLISLPENGMPPSLRELHILRCSPRFNERCRPVDGADWLKISHLSYISIDNRTVGKK